MPRIVHLRTWNGRGLDSLVNLRFRSLSRFTLLLLVLLQESCKYNFVRYTTRQRMNAPANCNNPKGRLNAEEYGNFRRVIIYTYRHIIPPYYPTQSHHKTQSYIVRKEKEGPEASSIISSSVATLHKPNITSNKLNISTPLKPTLGALSLPKQLILGPNAEIRRGAIDPADGPSVKRGGLGAVVLQRGHLVGAEARAAGLAAPEVEADVVVEGWRVRHVGGLGQEGGLVEVGSVLDWLD